MKNFIKWVSTHSWSWYLPMTVIMGACLCSYVNRHIPYIPHKELFIAGAFIIFLLLSVGVKFLLDILEKKEEEIIKEFKDTSEIKNISFMEMFGDVLNNSEN